MAMLNNQSTMISSVRLSMGFLELPPLQSCPPFLSRWNRVQQIALIAIISYQDQCYSSYYIKYIHIYIYILYIYTQYIYIYMLDITYFIYIKYVSIKSFASRVTNLLAPGQPKKMMSWMRHVTGVRFHSNECPSPVYGVNNLGNDHESRHFLVLHLLFNGFFQFSLASRDSSHLFSRIFLPCVCDRTFFPFSIILTRELPIS